MRAAKKTLSRVVIGGAAAAAAVKATLSTPLGAAAAPQLEQMSHELAQKGQTVVATGRPVIDQAGAKLGAVIGKPAQRAKTLPATTAPAPNPAVQEEPSNRGSGSRSHALMRKILRDAAVRHGIDPKLVLALSYWESGWDQTKVSETGAVGLMQVEPATAQEAGPALLGRTVDLTDPFDNAEVGVAIFREDLDAFRDPATALAAYYQGPTSLRQNGMLPDTHAYVDGILALVPTMNP